MRCNVAAALLASRTTTCARGTTTCCARIIPCNTVTLTCRSGTAHVHARTMPGEPQLRLESCRSRRGRVSQLGRADRNRST
jgi:hypothetical protein